MVPAHTWASVRHAQQKRLLVHLLKVLVLELLAVDALTTRTVAFGEITALVSRVSPRSRSAISIPALYHKALDHAMEA
jgi:hypothetical protein